MIIKKFTVSKEGKIFFFIFSVEPRPSKLEQSAAQDKANEDDEEVMAATRYVHLR